ncbi:hypothetical protein [Salinarimonas chemoclinalis]|uniref:hypothetical protein n=1 Tax=Salinarimonas chemoclinalis TaxID=3241599 RepID=UPI003555D170
MIEEHTDHGGDASATSPGSAAGGKRKRTKRNRRVPIDRRTRAARRLAELEAAYLAPLGDDVTEGDRTQARLAATLAVQVERMRERVARGEDVDGEEATRLANATQRALAPLQRRVKAKAKGSKMAGLTARQRLEARRNGGEA